MKSFAFDMLLKYMKINQNFKFAKEICLYDQTMLLQINDVHFDQELEVGQASISLVDGIKKTLIAKFDDLLVDNVPFESNIVTTNSQSKEDHKEIEDDSDLDPAIQDLLNTLKRQPFRLASGGESMVEVDYDIDQDDIESRLDELNVLFEKKKSHSMLKSSPKKSKRNYFNITFPKGIHIAMSQDTLKEVTNTIESIDNHLTEIKSLFYVSSSCLNDITGTQIIQGSQSSDQDSDKTVDIDDVLNNDSEKDSEKAFEETPVLHKSLFKFEISISKLQLDILDEEAPSLNDIVISANQSEMFNPFDVDYSLKEPRLTKKSTSQKEMKQALISFIAECTHFKLNMLEEVGAKDGTKKIKFELIIKDIICVNKLFVLSPLMDISLTPVSYRIPLFPKLFDHEDIACHKIACLNYEITIDNILQKNPERVIFYIQRGLSERYAEDQVHCLKFETFLILKTIKQPVACEFNGAEQIVNLHKSLDNPLPFYLFSKYWCVFYEPVIKNDIFININAKGLILNATNIHDWHEFIPKPDQNKTKENFTMKIDNSLSLKLEISDFTFDYTPCVTSESILEIYKNYKYKLDASDQAGDPSNNGFPSKTFYKTNTRLLSTIWLATIEMHANDSKFDLQAKMIDFDNYLLWTRDYSPKWSCEVLYDEEYMINTAQHSILSKMGFVNILKNDRISVSMNQELYMEGTRGKNKLRTIASLPDMYDSETLEIPRIYLNSTFKNEGPCTIKVTVSEIGINWCHDSILGVILLAQYIEKHITKAIQRINKHSQKVGIKPELTDVIQEEDENDSDDAETLKPGLDLASFIDECTFDEDATDIYLKKQHSKNSIDLRKTYDIVNECEEENKKEPEAEATGGFYEGVNIIDDYLNSRKGK
jgi:hypothetical protein